MTVRRITTTVRIAGQIFPAHDIATDHSVNEPVGTATVTVSAPRQHVIQPGATVTIHAGFDGAAWPIFSGRVADDNSVFDAGGGMVRVECDGWARLLFYKMPVDLGYSGPRSLDFLFRSLCIWRGVPHFLADAATAPDGMSNIMLGSNPDVRNGWIPLDRGTSPGAELDRYARLFGYRMYDMPQGTVRLKRISGLPGAVTETTPLYEAKHNVLSISRDRSYEGLANYWEVFGARYQAADTSEVAIRSIPATVTTNPIFGPDGVAHRDLRDESLVTETLARAVRNAHEIDYGAPAEMWTWRTTGQPERQPGETVAVLAPDVTGWDTPGPLGDLVRHIPRAVWLMRVRHSITDAGWTTDMEGWAGYGQQLPAGNDCVVQTLLGSQGVHIGNEWLSHYRNPSPRGTHHDIPFTVVDGYSTATVRYWGHGTNSFVGNTESEASRFEVWHSTDTDRPSMSGVMPRLPEDLERRYPYGEKDGSSTYTYRGWHRGVVPLTGRLKAGNNTFRIIAGEDRTVGDIDDYEIADVQLTLCGIGEPEIVP